MPEMVASTGAKSTAGACETRSPGTGSVRAEAARSRPDVSDVSTFTTADRPTSRGCSLRSAGSISMRTGTRWTILIQLPVAFWGGRREKALPVPAEKPVTRP